jgi:hypothetical protein
MLRVRPLVAFALLIPVAAHAGARVPIDETRALSVALALRTSVAAVQDAAPDGENPGYDLVLEGAVLALNGELARPLKIQLNFARVPTGEARVLDAILMLEPSVPVRLWLGRFLPPADRATLTGPFFSSAWDPPFVAAWPSVAAGRDDGVAAWSELAGGKLELSAGVFNGRPNPHDRPLVAGRVAVNLLDPEPGYYTAGSYLGAKDILSVGLAGRYQKRGANTMTMRGDFSGVSADLLVEKKLGDLGAATLEAAYYRYDFDGVIDPMVFPLGTGSGGYVLGAYLFPWQLWLGKVQTSARWQTFEGRDRVDGTVNYLIAGHATRIGLVVAHDDAILPGKSGVLVKLGAQLIL